MAEHGADGATRIRRITNVYPNWSSPVDLEQHGRFHYRLVLDEGAAEVIVGPAADEEKILRDLIRDADAFH